MAGLFSRVAKSAVAAGAAKKVMTHVRERQGGGGFGGHEASEPPQAPAAAAPAPPPAAPPTDPIQRLKDLADLKSQGILTDQEFEDQKSRILAA